MRLAQEPAAAGLPLRRDGALRGAWIAYGLGTAAALDVLNVAVPWLVAANLGAVAIAGAPASAEARSGAIGGWSRRSFSPPGCPPSAWLYFASKGAVLYAAGWAPAATAETIWSIVAPVYLLRISSFITFGLLPAGLPAWPS